jgi:hypothetical protein
MTSTGGALELEIRDIDACDEQDARDRADQRNEQVAKIAESVVVKADEIQGRPRDAGRIGEIGDRP